MLTKEEIEKKYPGKKLEDIKILNFYGDDFSNVDVISKMNSLEVISLSQNKISSLKPFQNLRHLKELILINNEIISFSEFIIICISITKTIFISNILIIVY